MSSNDIYFYFHMAFLCVAAAGILWADHSALDWIRGKIETIRPRRLLKLHWIVSVALVGLVISGLLMFWPERAYLMTEPQFWVKMAFVCALIINSFFIEHLMHRATTRPYKSLSLKQKLPLFISGGVSVVCWLGAATMAFFLFP